MSTSTSFENNVNTTQPMNTIQNPTECQNNMGGSVTESTSAVPGTSPGEECDCKHNDVKLEELHVNEQTCIQCYKKFTVASDQDVNKRCDLCTKCPCGSFYSSYHGSYNSGQ